MAIKKVKTYLYPRISSLQQQSGFDIQRQINNVMDFLSEAQLPLALGYQLDPESLMNLFYINQILICLRKVLSMASEHAQYPLHSV